MVARTVLSLLFFATTAGKALSQNAGVSASAEEGENVSAVREAQNSVVSIMTVSRSERTEGTRVGSGFLYQKHFIVTRKSVVNADDSIEIALPDGRTGPAKLIHCDDCNEIAVLEHAFEDVTPVRVGETSGLRKGSHLTILGNSLGIFPSVTLGKYIAMRPDSLIEIAGMIPPGNCGSPVLDARGRLVGMIVGRFQNQREPSQVVGLAMPSETIRSSLCKTIKSPGARTGWIGLSVVDLADAGRSSGVRVVSVTPRGPAHRAEICIGDTIVRFQGDSVRSARELSVRVKESPPDSKVSFSIRRGKHETVRLVKVRRLPLFR